VKGLDVRRTTISLFLPKGFAYEFETGMEEVEQADIEAGRATDVYREIKDLYSVADRGNIWQQQRALENAQLLEREVKGLADKLQSIPATNEQRQQVLAQQEAISKLRQTAKTPQTGFLTFSIDEGAAADRNTVAGWGSNRAARLKDADAMEQLSDFEYKKKQRRAAAQGQEATISIQGGIVGAGGSYGGPSGGVPPGLREPSDPEPTPPAPSGGAEPMTPSTRSHGKQVDRKTRERLGRYYRDGMNKQWEDVLDQLEVAELPQEEADKEVQITMSETIRASTARGKTIDVTYRPEMLTKAKGRISIKIDLPFDREMQVYHFAKLAPEGSVTVEATEGESRFLQELATLVCFGAACLLVFLRRK